MNKAIEAARLPYIMLCTALVACGLFFGTQLWQEGGGQKIRDGLLYAPGFVVKAEVVDVVRVVAFAGARVRSPSVDADTGFVVQLAH